MYSLIKNNGDVSSLTLLDKKVIDWGQVPFKRLKKHRLVTLWKIICSPWPLFYPNIIMFTIMTLPCMTLENCAYWRGCVTAVKFILFNFDNYSPSIAMELKVSKEIRGKWQNQRSETHKINMSPEHYLWSCKQQGSTLKNF